MNDTGYIKGTHKSQKIEIRYMKPRNDGYQKVATEFIHKIFKGFAAACLKSYHPALNMIDMPYYYSERRFDTAILPVLFKLCDGKVLTELPVKRKVRGQKEKNNGRVDYWCVYNGYTFVIEMKQSFKNLGGSKVRKHSMKDRWKEMSCQLNDCRTYLKENFTERTEGIIPIGLHFVTARLWESHKGPTNWNRDERVSQCWEQLETFADDLSPICDPDYYGAWIVPKSVAMSTTVEEMIDERFMCPYVMLFSLVKEIIPHP